MLLVTAHQETPSRRIPNSELLFMVLLETVVLWDPACNQIPSLLLEKVLFEIVELVVWSNAIPHNTVNPDNAVCEISTHELFCNNIPHGLVVALFISNLCDASNPAMIILLYPTLAIYAHHLRFNTVFPIVSPFATRETQLESILKFAVTKLGTLSITKITPEYPKGTVRDHPAAMSQLLRW